MVILEPFTGMRLYVSYTSSSLDASPLSPTRLWDTFHFDSFVVRWHSWLFSALWCDLRTNLAVAGWNCFVVRLRLVFFIPHASSSLDNTLLMLSRNWYFDTIHLWSIIHQHPSYFGNIHERLIHWSDTCHLRSNVLPYHQYLTSIQLFMVTISIFYDNIRFIDSFFSDTGLVLHIISPSWHEEQRSRFPSTSDV